MIARTHANMFFLRLLLHFSLLLLLTNSAAASASASKTSETESSKQGKKIAIIGGSISGTFTAKYLSDYDVDCSLDSITIYEPYSILGTRHDTQNHQKDDDKIIKSEDKEDEGDDEGGGIGSHDNNDKFNVVPKEPMLHHHQQGPRVSSIQLSDGKTVVELGASVIFSGNKLVVEMIQNDNDLSTIEPLSGNNNDDKNDGIGVFHGFPLFDGVIDDHGSKTQTATAKASWPLFTSNMTKEETTETLLWRYNLDLYKIDKATDSALSSFEEIYNILKSKDKHSFEYTSPNDVWRQVGLDHAASISLDQLLDEIGISNYISWWRRWLLKDQGLFRDELFTGMNICNNNKNNAQMTGLAGLVNFVASKGDLFAVKGGNHRLVQSAFQQAQTNYNHSCASKTKSDNNKVIHSQTEVKTVVSDFESNGMELFDTNGKLLDTYDIVILATPLQFSGISFLTKGSLFDNNVLAQMTLNGMVDSEDSNANDHGHRAAFGGELPDSAVRKYSQVVTTIVSNATFNKTHFAIDDNLTTPKSILFTENGRNETGISSIGCITPKVFKIFSSNELSQETISTIFGPNVKVEYVKNWGNKNGGATPDFNGGGDSSRATQFLIYDGGHGTNSLDEEGSALYYVNSMESAVAAIEISAIGARAVAKLVAKRLGLVDPIDDETGEEL